MHHPQDVLHGRGRLINEHPGNQRYRSLVESLKPSFTTAKHRKDKRPIALNIKQQIHNSDPPGRFLVEDNNNNNNNNNTRRVDDDDDIIEHCNGVGEGVHSDLLKRAWVEVSDDKAMVKIMHILREPTKPRSRCSRRKDGKENKKSAEKDDDISNEVGRESCARSLILLACVAADWTGKGEKVRGKQEQVCFTANHVHA